jgi:ABC-type dipeptide/oligopeptide/nickel transport system ATPase component
MSGSEKTSVAKMILQAVEDFATIVKGEIDIAKKSLTNSVKKIGSGIGLIITAFLLLNVSLLFLLIALAYGFIQWGMPSWASFLLVAAIMIGLAIIFALLAFRSFRKVRGVGDASRIGSETTKYLAENIKKPKKDSGWNSVS